MDSNHEIRSAVLSDAETIFNFVCHLEERNFDFESFKERFSENLNNRDNIYLVAVNEEDESIGFISCHGQSLLHHEGKVFEIQEMYVARNNRDRGIGKALFAALQERLSKMDCESLEVTANIKRSDARRFYTKLGFVQTHVKFVKEM
ncbi:MAG TPA: GNAT family N-acetyltransferase [Puia sp.]|jgi:PhnO protein|nr:GNAT family N-acetyltransferase [Puia sp.]